MSEPIPGTFYRHYKGGLYYVMALAQHTERDTEFLVIYRHVGGNVYARPSDVWRSPAKVEGEPVARGGPARVMAVERFTALPPTFTLSPVLAAQPVPVTPSGRIDVV